jgi:hypothetical protein
LLLAFSLVNPVERREVLSGLLHHLLEPIRVSKHVILEVILSGLGACLPKVVLGLVPVPPLYFPLLELFLDE